MMALKVKSWALWAHWAYFIKNCTQESTLKKKGEYHFLVGAVCVSNYNWWASYIFVFHPTLVPSTPYPHPTVPAPHDINALLVPTNVGKYMYPSQ